MDEKDVKRLQEFIEDTIGSKITVEATKKIAVFMKMYLSMGADFEEEINELDALCLATAQVFYPSSGYTFEPEMVIPDPLYKSKITQDKYVQIDKTKFDMKTAQKRLRNVVDQIAKFRKDLEDKS